MVDVIVDGNEAAATIEGIVADGGHRIADGQRAGEAAAAIEGILADFSHGVGDGQRAGEAAAIFEGIVADGGHRLGDGECFDATNQCICGCLNHTIAIIPRIIFWTALCNNKSIKTLTIAKRTPTDFGHRVGYGQRAGEAAATLEGILADGCHGVGLAAMRHCRRNGE